MKYMVDSPFLRLEVISGRSSPMARFKPSRFHSTERLIPPSTVSSQDAISVVNSHLIVVIRLISQSQFSVPKITTLSPSNWNILTLKPKFGQIWSLKLEFWRLKTKNCTNCELNTKILSSKNTNFDNKIKIWTFESKFERLKTKKND